MGGGRVGGVVWKGTLLSFARLWVLSMVAILLGCKEKRLNKGTARTGGQGLNRDPFQRGRELCTIKAKEAEKSSLVFGKICRQDAG